MLTMLLMAAQETTTTQPQKCLAVQSAGSHTFRNMVLTGGIAGSLMSKEQYKVVAVTNYPAKVGDKFHGNDLETIKGNGTTVVLVGKKATKDDIKTACPATN